MAKPNLYDLLEDSLAQLKTEENLGDILVQQVHFEPELRPLLMTAVLLQGYSRVPPPESAYFNTLDKTLAYAARLKQSRTKTQGSIGFSFPTFALRFAVAIIFLGFFFTGVTARAQSALPGDLLYSWKRGSEDVRLALTANEETQRSLKTEFANRRTEEVRSLITLSRIAQVEFSGKILFQSDKQWQIDEFIVQITATTIFDKKLKPGDRVVVQGQTLANGKIQADSIQLLPNIELEPGADSSKPIVFPSATPSPTSTSAQLKLPETKIEGKGKLTETLENNDEKEEKTPTTSLEIPEPEETITPSLTPEPSETDEPTQTRKPTKTQEFGETETKEEDDHRNDYEASKTPEPSETP